jgi:hypothetical protein
MSKGFRVSIFDDGRNRQFLAAFDSEDHARAAILLTYPNANEFYFTSLSDDDFTKLSLMDGQLKESKAI